MVANFARLMLGIGGFRRFMMDLLIIVPVLVGPQCRLDFQEKPFETWSIDFDAYIYI
jgi:hypothetical protein